MFVNDTNRDGIWTVNKLEGLPPDELEVNDWIARATVLGSLPQVTLRDLTIHDQDDIDYFQVTAAQTGKLIVNTHFDSIWGNIDLRITDGDGNEIAVSASDTDDERIVIPVVAQQQYFIEVTGTANWYELEVENFAAPIPFGGFLDPASDAGRSDADNVTNVSQPQLYIQADVLNFVDTNRNDARDDGEIAALSATQATDGNTPGVAVEVWLTNTTTYETVREFVNPISSNFPVLFNRLTPPTELSDGVYVVNAATWIFDGQRDAEDEPASAAGRTMLSDILFQFTIDTAAPPVSITGIAPSSTDTGVEGQPGTFNDGITSDTATGFVGTAEADAIVHMWADGDLISHNVVDDSDCFQGLTTTVSLDGNSAFPSGQWSLGGVYDLNNPDVGFPLDGRRQVGVTAQDVAGNMSDPEFLNVFIDTRGPQVTDVFISGDPGYNLFDQKEHPVGRLVPTPLAHSLSIEVRDLPGQATGFLYGALVEAVAENPGQYLLVGDANGEIPVVEVVITNNPVDPGQVATATIELEFDEPLPDDRFTLTILDGLVDPAGNALDGESNATGPLETPLLPSGDGQPGGTFQARFTVDSRPEVAVWASGNVWADTNGNFTFDPDNSDYTNHDITFALGFTSDDLFVGNFVQSRAATADGFDKLAAYGRVGNKFRWLIDLDNDGAPDLVRAQGTSSAFNGLPVAGNFDGNPLNGDEVAIFTGTKWRFDTNHNFKANASLVNKLVGQPIVGDFDGDGFEDLATWTDDRFQFDLSSVGGTVFPTLPGLNGKVDVTFNFGFSGTRERPVAADIDMDGFDDLGLWVPDRSGATSEQLSQWCLLVSGGQSILSRIEPDLDRPGTKKVDFTPVPFGPDMSAWFGNEFTLPLLGNFDPPVSGSAGPNVEMPQPPDPDQIGTKRGRVYALDVNGDGRWNGKAGGDMAYGFLAAGDKPVVGDWNGDGHDEIGTFRPGNRKFFLDANGNGKWDGRPGGDLIQFLGGKKTDRPIAGDFNGDGIDEVGLHRGRVFLVDMNGNGRWDKRSGGDMVYVFGAADDLPVIGDWDGDGVDDVGAYRTNNKRFYLDANGSGRWDSGDVVHRSIAAVGTPIAGDWDGDGVDQIGIHKGRNFYLDLNGNGRWDKKSGGDMTYVFGASGSAPLVGNWRPPAPLLAAPGAAPVTTDSTASLSHDALAPMVEHAIDVWSATPLSAGQRQMLEQVDVRIADLPGAMLGQAIGTTITLDIDAAGWGWFVDATPGKNTGFLAGQGSSSFAACLCGPADGKFDLLTAVFHELGHVLGEDHGEVGVMRESLTLSTRRLPGVRWDLTPDVVDRAFRD